MTPPLITILDDEPAIRSMLSEALQDAGFDTKTYARATEFEAELRRLMCALSILACRTATG